MKTKEDFSIDDRVTWSFKGNNYTGTIVEINLSYPPILVQFDITNDLFHSGTVAEGTYLNNSVYWCHPKDLTKIKGENEMSKESTIEWEIVKPFSLIDIAKKRPCWNQFIALMEDDGTFSNIKDAEYNSWHEVKDVKTFMNNLPWLEENGFIRKKKYETHLERGMKIENTFYHSTYITITHPDKEGYLLINLSNGARWTSTTVETLEELNRREYSHQAFRIISE